MQPDEMIHDWNLTNNSHLAHKSVELCDETLRDGLQSPSVIDPPIEAKKIMLKFMNDLGVFIADIGLPGAGPRAVNDVTELAKYIGVEKLQIKANCAARTVIQDIKPIVDIQSKTGTPLVAYCFLGTSPIRQFVENWDIEKLLKTADEALSFAVKEGLEVAFVTEDTTRSHPDTLKKLFEHVISLGCKRLVLCDTVGHSTPHGVQQLVQWTKKLIKSSKEDVKIDWHGHNDRGLGVINSIVAAQSGCDRIHGTCLGIGERVGNASIDQLMVNFKLLNQYEHDVKKLVQYVEYTAKACNIDIPVNYPLCGEDAFRTATGVHAAAVIKAEEKGKDQLADMIYSGVPAGLFGKKQQIEIGPMSGLSNVRYWLKTNNIKANDELCQKILHTAKKADHVLSNIEIQDIIAS